MSDVYLYAETGHKAGTFSASFKKLLVGASWMAIALPASAYAQSADNGVMLPEIVVTAEKRVERIQDVPISMTAIGQENLERRGLKQMGDYLLAQPSVVVQDRGPARNQIVIRGISTLAGNENPTVAFYLGETPLTTGLGTYALGFPDFKTFDVNRVEVLRGPQGTLYGAGSMGGTVKVVTNEPEFGGLGGHAEASLSSTDKGGQGGNLGAALNIPLSDGLALRVVGYRYEDAGYIDNRYSGSPDPTLPVAALGGASWADVGVSAFGVPARNDKNANSRTTNGARISLNWKATDRLKVLVGGFYQRSVADGLTENLPELGAYMQSRTFGEGLKDEFKVANLTATYSLDGADIVAATAYVDRQQGQDRDVSSFFLASPLRLADGNRNKTFSQELRIASSGDGPFGWLIGGFYSHTRARSTGHLSWIGTGQSQGEFTSLLAALGVLAAPAFPGDPLFDRNERSTGEQFAGFGELSYAVTNTLTASAGVRLAHYKITSASVTDGVFNGGRTVASLGTKESVTTPKFQLEFKPDRNQLYYIKAAKGFRLGAPNSPVSSTCAPDLADLGLTAAPASQKSDSLWSYEAGAKQTLAGGRATVSAAAFYIDWTNIQTGFLLPNCGFSFGGNAGNATSKGVELEVNWRVGSGLTLNGGGSYTNARLSNDSPPATGVGGKKGDRLPGIPRWSLLGGAQYDQTVLGKEAFGRVDVRYISSYLNRFPGDTAGPESAGGFAVVDVRAGVQLSEGLKAEFFTTNLFNNKQMLSVDTELPDQRQVLGRPRTIGVVLRYGFGGQ
jgi:iron complex outermembrane recepter protein